jgi:hypothetical protein
MFSGATLEINSRKKVLEKYSTRSAEKENAARWSGVHGG